MSKVYPETGMEASEYACLPGTNKDKEPWDKVILDQRGPDRELPIGDCQLSIGPTLLYLPIQCS